MERGEEAVKELEEKHGIKVGFHQLDIEDQQSIDRLADYIKRTYGGLDILVNNAAIATEVRFFVVVEYLLCIYLKYYVIENDIESK